MQLRSNVSIQNRAVNLTNQLFFRHNKKTGLFTRDVSTGYLTPTHECLKNLLSKSSPFRFSVTMAVAAARTISRRVLDSQLSTSRKLTKSRVHFDKRFFSLGQKLDARYIQYQGPNGGLPRLGAQLGCDGDIIDISAVDSSIPNSLVKFLGAGQDVRDKAKR